MVSMRIDQALVQRRLVDSRSRAADMVAMGHVTVNGKIVRKPSQMVRDSDSIETSGHEHPWVSRGGMKLAHAIKHWKIDVKGAIAVDVGASTGGFTDVLLEHEAAKVYAVDVGHDQLHIKLKNDERVVNLEGVNARELSCELLTALGEGKEASQETRPLVREALSPIAEASRPEQGINVIVCDASFISLKLVLNKLLSSFAGKQERGQEIEGEWDKNASLPEGARAMAQPCHAKCLASVPSRQDGEIASAASVQLISLIKPQFEVGKDALPKDGVVKDDAQREAVCKDIAAWVESLGWQVQGITESPIEGPKGNKEFLLYAIL